MSGGSDMDNVNLGDDSAVSDAPNASHTQQPRGKQFREENIIS